MSRFLVAGGWSLALHGGLVVAVGTLVTGAGNVPARSIDIFLMTAESVEGAGGRPPGGLARPLDSAAPRRVVESEGVSEFEERHGFAGALRALGGLGGPSRPPMYSSPDQGLTTPSLALSVPTAGDPSAGAGSVPRAEHDTVRASSWRGGESGGESNGWRPMPGAGTGAGDGPGAAGAGAPPGRMAALPSSSVTFAAPRYDDNARPAYPWRARARGEQGTVLLAVHVNERGRVGDARVAKSSGSPALDEAALTAVKRWTFQPARRGGEPVASWVQVPLRFQLDE